MKFFIYVEEEFYYPCSEKKGADQLCSYCTADLRLCFRICRLLVFLCGGSFINKLYSYSFPELDSVELLVAVRHQYKMWEIKQYSIDGEEEKMLVETSPLSPGVTGRRALSVNSSLG